MKVVNRVMRDLEGIHKMSPHRCQMFFTLSILMILITACGHENAYQDFQGKKVPDTESATTLKWAVWDAASTSYYQMLVDSYEEEYPNINIELVDLGSQDYNSALTNQLANEAADLDVVSIKDMPGYVNMIGQRLLRSIDVSDMAEDEYLGVMEQMRLGGELYALPFRNDFWLIFYNKDIFIKMGLSYPQNDMTIGDYDDLIRKVSDQSIGEEIYGGHFHVWRSTIQLFGILDGKNNILQGNYEFLKPYYEELLMLQDEGYIQDYAILKTTNTHYSGSFASGNVATMNMGSWFIGTLLDKIGSNEYNIDQWGIVRYPHPEGVESGTTLSTITSLGIASASKHQEEAESFVKYVAGSEGAQILASIGMFPAINNDSVIDTIADLPGFPEDEASKEALKTHLTYLEMPLHESAGEIEGVLNEGHDAIMIGTMTVDEGIEYMDREVQKILE